MKQEIFCSPCAVDMKKIIGKHPGEHTKFVEGRSLGIYRCDLCGETIPALSACVAFSIWTDIIPRIEGWERKYIIFKEVENELD